MYDTLITCPPDRVQRCSLALAALYYLVKRDLTVPTNRNLHSALTQDVTGQADIFHHYTNRTLASQYFSSETLGRMVCAIRLVTLIALGTKNVIEDVLYCPRALGRDVLLFQLIERGAQWRLKYKDEGGILALGFEGGEMLREAIAPGSSRRAGWSFQLQVSLSCTGGVTRRSCWVESGGTDFARRASGSLSFLQLAQVFPFPPFALLELPALGPFAAFEPAV